MGIFRRNWNKPGPGVEKDAPRKKGLARFFELIGRDFGGLVKVNLLYQLCLLPAQACVLASVLFFVGGYQSLFLLFLLLALAGSVLVGPAGAAMNYCITKMLRDEPGFIWHDFKRVFKRTFRGMAAPGVLYALILVAQVYALLYYGTAAGASASVPMVITYLLSSLLFAMASPYLFLQGAYLQLKMGGLLKNSVLLSVGFFLRSLASALIHSVFLLLQLRLFPLLLPLTLLCGYALPCLLGLMWIWPPFEETFELSMEQETL